MDKGDAPQDDGPMTQDEADRIFPVAELARMLGAGPAAVAAFLRERPELGALERRGRPGLHEARLDAFFRAWAEAQGIRPKAYDLPPDLLASPEPWACALVRLYREPSAYPACLSPSQGRQLRDLVLAARPARVVEVGCFIGVSSLWIGSALKELGAAGRLDSVDLFEPIGPWPPHRFAYVADPLALARSAAKAARLEGRITFHRMNSVNLPARIEAMAGGPVDLLFIDGDHSDRGAAHDFLSLAPRVRVGGTILLHDIYPEFCGWTGPRHVLDRYVLPSPHFSVTEIATEPRNYGMAVIRKLGDDPAMSLGPKLRLYRWKSRLRWSRWGRWIQKARRG